VDILGLRLPRWRREEALDFLLARLRQGLSTGVAFADISTVNVCRDHPDFETSAPDPPAGAERRRGDSTSPPGGGAGPSPPT
jgi:hypothetical protein